METLQHNNISTTQYKQVAKQWKQAKAKQKQVATQQN